MARLKSLFGGSADGIAWAPEVRLGAVASDPGLPVTQRFGGVVTDALRLYHRGKRWVQVPAPEANAFDGDFLAFAEDDHWHLSTAGLASPAQPAAGEDLSGRGYELTLRVPRTEFTCPFDQTPWPLALLSRLADYVVTSGAALGPGSRMENTSPLDGHPASVATHLFVVPDNCRRVDGPSGFFSFHQIVPVTAEELDRIRSGAADDVVATLGQDNPLLIARLGR